MIYMFNPSLVKALFKQTFRTMKSVVILLFFNFFVIESKAQLMSNKVFYPGVKSIKEKQFSGSGGDGYWILKQCDSLGRTIVQENYKNQQLLAKSIFEYNSHNDQRLKINVFDIIILKK